MFFEAGVLCKGDTVTAGCDGMGIVMEGMVISATGIGVLLFVCIVVGVVGELWFVLFGSNLSIPGWFSSSTSMSSSFSQASGASGTHVEGGRLVGSSLSETPPSRVYELSIVSSAVSSVLLVLMLLWAVVARSGEEGVVMGLWAVGLCAWGFPGVDRMVGQLRWICPYS